MPVHESPIEPKPRLEKSRGQQIDHEDVVDGSKSTEAAAAETEKAKAPEDEKPKGKYVGIPEAGFTLFAKYNKDERIILIAKKEGRTILALDSGQRVTVSDDGLEVDRRDRTDETKGGRKWESGDSYFEGEKVTKVAGSKKDPLAIRLLLDSGFEVRLNRWGNEERRKKREEKPDAAEPEPPKEEKKEEKTDPESVKVEHDDRVGKEVVEVPAKSEEAKAPGDNEEVDIDDIEDVAKLRMIATPLLKRYCETVLKRRVSPKEAYKELTGVVLTRGQSMMIDDYRVLYQCLEEALEGASA
jgi:hypothetical protein